MACQWTRATAADGLATVALYVINFFQLVYMRITGKPIMVGVQLPAVRGIVFQAQTLSFPCPCINVQVAPPAFSAGASAWSRTRARTQGTGMGVDLLSGAAAEAGAGAGAMAAAAAAARARVPGAGTGTWTAAGEQQEHAHREERPCAALESTWSAPSFSRAAAASPRPGFGSERYESVSKERQ